MKKEKKIKAWAVIFAKSQDIYESLTDGKPLQQKAIFSHKKEAKLWVKKFGKEEPYKPKIVEVEIRF